MKYKVYADPSAPGDSIGVREDGATTAVFGDSPTSWQFAKHLIWLPVILGADPGAYLFSGEYQDD